MHFIRKLFRHDQTVKTHHCTVDRNESMSFLPRLGRRPSTFQRFRRALKKSCLISERNPLSMEYFRSKAEILRIRKQQVEANSYVIHPFSDFRAYYEMWMVFAWFCIILYMPLDAAFDLFTPPKLTLGGSNIEAARRSDDFINWALQLIGGFDIVLTFLTGYIVKKKRKVVMAPWRIAKNYMFSLLFVADVLASIPPQFIVHSYSNQRMISSFGFVRILRLPTFVAYATRTIEFFGGNAFALQMLKHFAVNYLIFHWFACLLYMVPQLRFFAEGGVSTRSWISRNDLIELDFVSKYSVCLYRSIAGLLCIIVGESPVEMFEEKVLYICMYIFGKIYTFYLTVLILNYLLRKRSLEVKYFEIISQVQAYMTQKQLPIQTQARLLQFYEYKYNKKFFKERGITGLLSEKLRGEINLNICSRLVQNVALLAHLPPQHLEQVVVNLKPEIYLVNDIIIKAGSVGDCMYFLASGTVGVWTPSGKEMCHLQDGAYFGEISLVFKDKRRTANIVAIEICEVYKLDRKAFRNCFKSNAALFKMLEEVANERMEITQMFEDVHAKTFLELTH